jgi:hypothetical protein
MSSERPQQLEISQLADYCNKKLIYFKRVSQISIHVDILTRQNTEMPT